MIKAISCTITQPGAPDKVIHKELTDKEMDSLNKAVFFMLSDRMAEETPPTPEDIYGCDRFFLDSFFTYEMMNDFPLIAQDFYRHEFQNLSQYTKEDSFKLVPDHFMKQTNPLYAIEKQLLALMYSAALHGSEYATRLFQTLYKTYYHNEYQQLKRFGTLSVTEIFTLAEDADSEVSMRTVSRLLTMSRIMGINLAPNCRYLCHLVGSHFKKELDDLKQKLDTFSLEFPQELYEESTQQVRKWMDSGRGTTWKPSQLKGWRKAKAFLSAAFLQQSYPSDLLDLTTWHCYEDNLTDSFATTLTILRFKFPEETFHFEEVQFFTLLYCCAKAIISLIGDFQNFYTNCLGLTSTWHGDMPPIFKPDPLPPSRASQTSLSPFQISLPPVNNSPPSLLREEALSPPKTKAPGSPVDETAPLRKKLRQQEQEIHRLQGLYEAARKEKTDASSALEQYKNEREELIALRNHVYQSTEADVPAPPLNLNFMEKALRGKRIVIIGGHSNWTCKLRAKFPNWVFLSPKTSSSINNHLLDRADSVYFFTDFIRHCTYLRFIKIVREKGISFGYLHSTNIPANIQQIYRELFP